MHMHRGRDMNKVSLCKQRRAMSGHSEGGITKAEEPPVERKTHKLVCTQVRVQGQACILGYIFFRSLRCGSIKPPLLSLSTLPGKTSSTKKNCHEECLHKSSDDVARRGARKAQSGAPTNTPKTTCNDNEAHTNLRRSGGACTASDVTLKYVWRDSSQQVRARWGCCGSTSVVHWQGNFFVVLNFARQQLSPSNASFLKNPREGSCPRARSRCQHPHRHSS
jgi:hypothetical protein